jgi:hypothetical protein
MVLYALTFINNICRYLQISAQISTDICRYLQISADICADIWSRQQISGHAAKTHHIGINIKHRCVSLPISFLWENEKKYLSTEKELFTVVVTKHVWPYFSPVSPKQVPNVPPPSPPENIVSGFFQQKKLLWK